MPPSAYMGSYAPERILTTIRSLRSTVGWCGFVVSHWMEKGSECKISAANLRSDISIPFLPLVRNPFSNSIFSDELEEEKQAESKRSSDVACRKKVQMNSTHFQMKLSTERGMIFRRTPFLTSTFSWLQEGSLNGVFNSGAASRIKVEQRCRSPEEGLDELNPFSDEAVDRRGYDFRTNPFSDEHIFMPSLINNLSAYNSPEGDPETQLCVQPKLEKFALMSSPCRRGKSDHDSKRRLEEEEAPPIEEVRDGASRNAKKMSRTEADKSDMACGRMRYRCCDQTKKSSERYAREREEPSFVVGLHLVDLISNRQTVCEVFTILTPLHLTADDKAVTSNGRAQRSRDC
ncbi:hypothetical protein ACLOJK_000912 [Asimina triloba]